MITSSPGISSPWSRGAAHTGFEGAGWAPWLQGFALLAWLRTSGPASPAGPPAHDDDWGPCGPLPLLRDSARCQPNLTLPLSFADSADDWQSEAPEDDSKKPPPQKEPPARAAEPSHVLSLGHDSLVFEVWLDVRSGNLSCYTYLAGLLRWLV